jgi:hypothetical protein
LTSCVATRSNGCNSSIIAPTKRMIVDHMSPQKSRSECLISESLTASVGSTAVLAQSNSELPLWPVWIDGSLFIIFCIVCIFNIFNEDDDQ